MANSAKSIQLHAYIGCGASTLCVCKAAFCSERLLTARQPQGGSFKSKRCPQRRLLLVNCAKARSDWHHVPEPLVRLADDTHRSGAPAQGVHTALWERWAREENAQAAVSAAITSAAGASEGCRARRSRAIRGMTAPLATRVVQKSSQSPARLPAAAWIAELCHKASLLRQHATCDAGG